MLLLVPLPLLLGLFGALKASIASFSVIAMSDVGLKPSEVAGGVSEMLVIPMFGLLLMGPSYVTALIGLMVRSFQGK